VIAASNRDLAEEVRQGNFREDLYYRLNVLRITVPPLRQRPEDIPLLLDCFVRQVSEQCGKPVRGVDPEVSQALMCYHWPGNIRQLQNVVERAVNFAQGDWLTLDSLPDYVLESASAQVVFGARRSDRVLSPEQMMERDRVQATIARLNGNLVKAAAVLGISRSTLYRRLGRLGLTPGGVREARGG